jgi:hydroxymethylbilane synthase
VTTTLRLGTRGSALALAQTDLTRMALARAFPQLRVEVQTFVTRGDRKLEAHALPSGEAGVKGLFTKELEDALLGGTIDVAVHSLKDLPGRMTPGLQVTAVLPRANTADVLLTRDGKLFETLSSGACLGTSSVRRAHQLRALRPDLLIEAIRGNVPTRLRKLLQSDSYAGIVLAHAGLERLGYAADAGAFEFETATIHVESMGSRMLPAIGQGAIALQSPTGRDDVAALLAAINHPPTFSCIEAERELQRLLGGDCALPVGVRTAIENGRLRMDAVLFPPNAPEPPSLSAIRAHAVGDLRDRLDLARQLFAQLRPSHVGATHI